MRKNGSRMLFQKLHNKKHLALWLFASLLCFSCQPPAAQTDTVLIKKTNDFKIDGSGQATEWKATDWIRLDLLPTFQSDYQTAFKILYSEKGIYCLYKCEDSLLTNTIQEDGKALYTEDVIEIFLQPDSSTSNYFEYELSPLNFETVLLIFNKGGDLNSWQPFEIKEQRKIQHATNIRMETVLAGKKINEWLAEFFIPFELLNPVGGRVPQSGEQWKANFYRIDYDKGETLWTWKPNSGNFHEFQHFGTIEFE